MGPVAVPSRAGGLLAGGEVQVELRGERRIAEEREGEEGGAVRAHRFRRGVLKGKPERSQDPNVPPPRYRLW